MRELRAFTKVSLEPGESKTVSMTLNRRAFAYYDVNAKDWRVDSGVYAIQIGASSRDIRLTQSVTVQGAQPNPVINADVPAYCDLGSVWPVPREQFECVLGHPVPPERSIRPFSANSTLGEVQASFAGRMFYKIIQKNMAKQFGGGNSEGMEEFAKIIDAMLEDMPIRQLAMMSGGAMTPAVVAGLVEMMNGHYLRGLKKMKE